MIKVDLDKDRKTWAWVSGQEQNGFTCYTLKSNPNRLFGGKFTINGPLASADKPIVAAMLFEEFGTDLDIVF